MPDSTVYEFACGDVMDGCDAVFRGTRDDIMVHVVEHANEAHGIEQVTPEVASAVEQQMRPTG